MPRIFLKPNSADFADQDHAPAERFCDMPGCPAQAEHRAPKNRGLNEYYHFCMDHVREYNKAWNFFEGMSSREVEEHMLKSLYGDRPTWKYGVNGNAEDMLYTKAWQAYNYTDKEPPKEKQHRKQAPTTPAHTPEHEALAIMGLEPPVTLLEIKTRYKTLAKKYHPDLNKGCNNSQELLKQINMAYTILKLAFERFEELPNQG